MNTSYTLEPLANSLGVDSHILTYGIYILAILCVSLIIFSWTRSYLLWSIVVGGCAIAGGAFGLLPIWVVFLIGAPVMISLLLRVFAFCLSSPVTDEKKETPTVQLPKTYAETLKAAYEAKFGYRNEEFEAEVDSHVKALSVLRRGPTRKIHIQRLKALEDFVESKEKV